MITSLIFYLFSTIMVLSALMVISVKNPVKSVLFLILTFFNAAAVFVLLGAEFIAMLLVIVYVGAVAVLFLFVVMMLNINVERMREGFVKYLPLGIIVAGVLLIELYLIIQVTIKDYYLTIQKVVVNNPISTDVTNTHAIGGVLYTDYIYIFQVSGLILLVAMIGAIVLTKREREGVKRQNISKQVSRDSKTAIEKHSPEIGKGV